MVQIHLRPDHLPYFFQAISAIPKRARIRVSVQLSAFLKKTASVQRTFWTEEWKPKPAFSATSLRNATSSIAR